MVGRKDDGAKLMMTVNARARTKNRNVHVDILIYTPEASTSNSSQPQWGNVCMTGDGALWRFKFGVSWW